MEDRLLAMMFDMQRWEDMIAKADEKGINKTVLRKLCDPQTRLRFYECIKTENYEICPPHIALIPKDDGTNREVYVNEDVDRIFCSLANDCLMEIFHDMIHPKCLSYQKGIGCPEIVQGVSKEVAKLNKIIDANLIGYKYDFHHYFDTVNLDAIESIFDQFESRLGFEHETEPVLNILRQYYRSELIFNADKQLENRYCGLRQGCAVAAILADVVLYELDDFMSKKYKVYYRYSDDLIVLDSNTTEMTDDINRIISKYGVILNPKKVKPITKDKWFTFLGFSMKDDMITLSKNRVKKFQKEIEKRTIKHNKITAEQARRNVISYLYKGDGRFCWSTSCLSVINCKADLDEMNKFIMDCIRACQTGKRKIGGLGYVDNLPDRTVLRGTGKNVTANRNKTEREIQNYLTMACLSNVYKINKQVFDATVRGM